jgi:hypothetical protein
MSAVASTTFQRDANGIIYDIPPGKMVSVDGTEIRVTIKPSQGTCFYAAIDRLKRTSFIGYENPLSELQLKVEQQDTFVSQRLFLPDAVQFYKAIDTNMAEAILYALKNPTSSHFQKLEKSGLLSLAKKYCEIEDLQGFIADKEHSLHVYISHKFFRKRQHTLLEFLKAVGSINQYLQQSTQLTKDLPLERVGAFAQEYVQKLVSEKYNFVPFDWSSHKNIGEFITALDKYGPLIVGGKFGKAYYEHPAEERPPPPLSKRVKLYYWDMTRNKRKDQDRCHVVIVIGAVKGNFKGGGAVYFVDPNDPSDPTISQYNVYMVSYDNLLRNVKNFNLIGSCAIYINL